MKDLISDISIQDPGSSDNFFEQIIFWPCPRKDLHQKTKSLILKICFCSKHFLLLIFFFKCWNLHERSGMCWSEWKIPIYIFRVMVILYSMWSIFDEFSPITRKIKKKLFCFSIYSASFIKIISVEEGGRTCFIGKNQIFWLILSFEIWST